MTDGTRILRTAGIPLIIGLIFLFALPKMCVKAVIVSREHQEKTARASGGLHIESAQKPLDYPAALDAERVGYIIETDPHFSAPYMAHVSKAPPADILPADQALIAALQKLGYVETGVSTALTLSREGLLHLEGFVDEGASWTFPLAKRSFRSVTSIETSSGSAKIRFTWQWQPTSVGSALMPKPRTHDAKAEITSLSGRWTLVGISDLDDELQ